MKHQCAWTWVCLGSKLYTFVKIIFVHLEVHWPINNDIMSWNGISYFRSWFYVAWYISVHEILVYKFIQGVGIPDGRLPVGGWLEGEAQSSAKAQVAHSQARVQLVCAGRPLIAKASRSAIRKWLKTCLAANTCGYLKKYIAADSLKCCAWTHMHEWSRLFGPILNHK